jgi:hypothetical protein
MKQWAIFGGCCLLFIALIQGARSQPLWHPEPPAYTPHYTVGCDCTGKLYGMLKPARADLVPSSTMRKWEASQVQQAPSNYSSSSSQTPYKPYVYKPQNSQRQAQTKYKPFKFKQYPQNTPTTPSYTPTYAGTYSGGSSAGSAPNPGIANQAWLPPTPGAPSQ